MASTSLTQRNRVFGPIAGFTVYLHHKTVYKKLTTLKKNNSKSACVDLAVSWIKLAKHTLDIMFFYIFHKDIVNAIIKKQSSGVVCRIIMYKHVLEGQKSIKIGKYVSIMQNHGVLVRLIDVDKIPEPSYRIVMIDYMDPLKNRIPLNNEAGFVVGEQPNALILDQSICNDMDDIHVSKEAPVRTSAWPATFEEQWSSEHSYWA